jgi:hypothetical protein
MVAPIFKQAAEIDSIARRRNTKIFETDEKVKDEVFLPIVITGNALKYQERVCGQLRNRASAAHVLSTYN